MKLPKKIISRAWLQNRDFPGGNLPPGVYTDEGLIELVYTKVGMELVWEKDATPRDLLVGVADEEGTLKMVADDGLKFADRKADPKPASQPKPEPKPEPQPEPVAVEEEQKEEQKEEAKDEAKEEEVEFAPKRRGRPKKKE